MREDDKIINNNQSDQSSQIIKDYIEKSNQIITTNFVDN